jgi:hypothetical protein
VAPGCKHTAWDKIRDIFFPRIAGNEMESPREKEISDLDIRHFIYATFAGIGRPSTTLETVDHFKISISQNWHKGRLDYDWQRPDQAKVQLLF